MADTAAVNKLASGVAQSAQPRPVKSMPEPKGKNNLLVVVIILLLAACGFFGYRYINLVKPAGANVLQTTYELQAITVNLADTYNEHFLRVGIVLQYPQDNAALASELKNQQYIIVDKIISVLRTKTYDDLLTDQGLKALRLELLRTINGVLTKGKISNVFFREFLMQ